MSVHADDLIVFLQLAAQRDEVGENKYDMSLLTATGGAGMGQKKELEKDTSQLSKVGVAYSISDSIESVCLSTGGTIDWLL